MAKLTVLQELDAAIRTAAKEADPKTPLNEVATLFCRAETELIQPFLLDWAIEKVGTLLRKHRVETRRANDEQLQFEGILGLTHVPRFIRLKSGERVAKAEATRNQLRQALTEARNDRAVKDLVAAVELMGKYTLKERKITWGEVSRREAEKLEAKAKQAAQ